MFTANWCPSCKSSYPTVTKLNEEWKSKGLRTIFAVTLDGVFEGVAMDEKQEVEANRKYFVEKNKFPYPIAIQGKADEPTTPGQFLPTFNIGGYPQFFVIDKQGIVRGILMGWDPYGNRARVLTHLLQQLL
jgi:thiol-disulfide isomerase/thioredoxin